MSAAWTSPADVSPTIHPLVKAVKDEGTWKVGKVCVGKVATSLVLGVSLASADADNGTESIPSIFIMLTKTKERTFIHLPEHTLPIHAPVNAFDEGPVQAG